jgi:hypothetical protein
MITRGLGSNLIITRGLGYSTVITIIKREVIRLSSIIKKILSLKSEI